MAVDPPSTRLVLLQGLVAILLLGGLFWIPYRFWQNQPYPSLTLLLLPVLIWTVATRGIRGTLVVVLLYELGIVTMVMVFGQAERTLQYQVVMVAMVASGLLAGAFPSPGWPVSCDFAIWSEVSNDLLWEFDASGRLYQLSGQLARIAVVRRNSCGALEPVRDPAGNRIPIWPCCARRFGSGGRSGTWCCESACQGGSSRPGRTIAVYPCSTKMASFGLSRHHR